MNLLDIYKRLPRTNCGECPDKTCMAFAVKLSKNERSTSECPKLDKQIKKELDAMLSDADLSDWKEKRVEELFNEISPINFSEIANGIGAISEGDLLKIKYMGREVALSHSDFKDELGIWDKLLILIYVKNAGSASLSGKWTAFRDLKNGSVRAAGFRDGCEIPLSRMYKADREVFQKRLLAMGAEKVSGYSTKESFVVYPLPKIPFLLLLWPAEEGFEPDCKALLDSTAADFLDIETLLYLGLALVRAVNVS